MANWVIVAKKYSNTHNDHLDQEIKLHLIIWISHNYKSNTHLDGYIKIETLPNETAWIQKSTVIETQTNKQNKNMATEAQGRVKTTWGKQKK